MRLRDYQKTAVTRAAEALQAGANPIVVLPTGGGKSLVIAQLLKDLAPPRRALVLTHVQELVEQNVRQFERLAPEQAGRSGVYSAGLGRKEPDAPIVFAGVQSAYRAVEAFGPRDLIVIDEAHLVPRDGKGVQYTSILSHYRDAQRVGMTATPMRLDSGRLDEGEGAWFDCIAVDVPAIDLVHQGFLSPLRAASTVQQANLAGVAKIGHEYNQGAAENAIRTTLVVSQALDEAMRYCKKRESILVFAAGVEHANEIAREFASRDIEAGVVVGDTDTDERANIIAKFKSKELRVLVSVNALTTGFDAPSVDAIIVLRATCSPVLWQQMMGRGMRVADGKTDCLLLDFCSNLKRLGGVGVVPTFTDLAAPDVGKRKVDAGAPPQKRKALEFGLALNVDPMGATIDLTPVDVVNVGYTVIKSKKHAGKSILLANYDVEDEQGVGKSITQFVCVEYTGGAKWHATQWLKRRGYADKVASAYDALHLARTHRLAVPRTLDLRRNDRAPSGWEIVNEHFWSH